MPSELIPGLLSGYYNMDRHLAETENTRADTQYRLGQLGMQQQQMEAEQAAAPWKLAQEQQKYQENALGMRKIAIETEQQFAEFTAQRLAPILGAVERGELDEQAAMAHIAALEDEIEDDPVEQEQRLAGGLAGYRILMQQGRDIEAQLKPAPAPRAVQVGDQKVYLGTDGKQIPGLGGPMWAPTRPPGQKYGVTTDADGNPTSWYNVGPGGMRVELLPGMGGGTDEPPPLPVVPQSNIDKVKKHSGPIPAFAELWTNTIGAMMGTGAPAEMTETRLFIKQSADMVSQLSRDGRSSNQEMNQANRYLTTAAAFENQDSAGRAMAAAVRSMNGAYEHAMSVYEKTKSKKSLAPVARKSYEEAMQIRGALEYMTQPIGGLAAAGLDPKTNPNEYRRVLREANPGISDAELDFNVQKNFGTK